MKDSCFHCGDDIIGRAYESEDKQFCCNGCKNVYLLLSENGLDSFYEMESAAGIRPSTSNVHKYDFLEVPEIRERFIDFEDEETIHVTFFLPTIHCSSCIFLLENITKVDPRIISCQTNFTKKEAALVFDKNNLTLAELAILLDRIGYAPNFEEREEVRGGMNKFFLYKLGVAGFAFGSIMLWSFPEYLGIEGTDPGIRKFTSYLSLLISIPVLLFSANGYYRSAFKAIRHKTINIDVPITLGILALYAQSAVTILSNSGPGYMDSFAGFIFFLLIGKWFQNKTYQSLSFERDRESYFPIAVLRKNENKEEIVEIDKLSKDDILLIRNDEIIPCDSFLASETAQVDYSFVTGESLPKRLSKGDLVFAGGKIIGKRTEFIVKNTPKRSRLNELWDATSSQEGQDEGHDRLSLYFLIVVLLIALINGIVWVFIGPSLIVHTVVSVLIVACPCALALSRPFTFGNTLRKLGREGLYLKNVGVIQKMNGITDIVFDKTGTLTKGSYENAAYLGSKLTSKQISQIMILTRSSSHPLSRGILKYLAKTNELEELQMDDFSELPGKGVQAKIDEEIIMIGAKDFLDHESDAIVEIASYVKISGRVIGKFTFHSELRRGVPELINRLSISKNIHVLSGDDNKDFELLRSDMPNLKEIHFNQTPTDKLNYIRELQVQKRRVMMIGDGLNEVEALVAADVGIAISDDGFQFTSSSDAILEAKGLPKLEAYLKLSSHAKTVLGVCIWFSIAYNSVGLFFAVSGILTPLIAAVLIPISPITILIISTLLVLAKRV